MSSEGAMAELILWLADHGGARTEFPALLAGLGTRLNALGVPVLRLNLNLDDFHPEVIGRSYVWHRERGGEETDRRYTPKANAVFAGSPLQLIYDGAAAVRRRLDGAGAEDFAITRELKAQGATDYAGMALVFSDGSRQFASFATDAPGGFTQAQLEALDAILPYLRLRAEVEHARRSTEQLLATYLGADAARRVIGGTIRRNAGETIEAIVLACDLRGFTQLADSHRAEEVIEALGEFFEAVAQPVTKAGGDIVKMVGDGILAVFPLELRPKDENEGRARLAAEAVREALAALAAIKGEALPAGIPELRAGFALHAGRVTFGNVGSRDRLDFTLIGLAVNAAFRLETLTKTLGEPALASAQFAELAKGKGLKPLGAHELRGVSQKMEVFALAP